MGELVVNIDVDGLIKQSISNMKNQGKRDKEIKKEWEIDMNISSKDDGKK